MGERLLHKSTLKWWGLVHTGGTREMGTLQKLLTTSNGAAS